MNPPRNSQNPDDDIPGNPLDGYCLYNPDGTVRPVSREDFFAAFARLKTVELTVRAADSCAADATTH